MPINCSKCIEGVIENDNGLQVCINCGFVTDSVVLVNDSWEGNPPPTSSSSFLSSRDAVVGHSQKRRFNAVVSTQKTCHKSVEIQINDICSCFSFNTQMAEEMSRIYYQVYKEWEGIKSLNSKVTSAAIAYVFIKKHNKPITLMELTERLQVNFYKVGKIAFRVFKAVGIQPQQHIDMVGFVDRATNHFRENYPLDTLRNIRRMTVELIHFSNKNHIIDGRSPTSIVCASLYLALSSISNNKKKIDMSEITSILSAKNSTTLLRSKEIEKLLLAYAKERQFFFKFVTEKNLLSYLSIILKDFTVNSNTGSRKPNGKKRKSLKEFYDHCTTETFQKNPFAESLPPAFVSSTFKRLKRRLKIIKTKQRLLSFVNNNNNNNNNGNQHLDLSHIKITDDDLQFFEANKKFDDLKTTSTEDLLIEKLLLYNVDENKIIDGWANLESIESEKLCKLHPNLLDVELNENDIPSSSMNQYIKSKQEIDAWKKIGITYHDLNSTSTTTTTTSTSTSTNLNLNNSYNNFNTSSSSSSSYPSSLSSSSIQSTSDQINNNTNYNYNNNVNESISSFIAINIQDAGKELSISSLSNLVFGKFTSKHWEEIPSSKSDIQLPDITTPTKKKKKNKSKKPNTNSTTTTSTSISNATTTTTTTTSSSSSSSSILKTSSSSTVNNNNESANNAPSSEKTTPSNTTSSTPTNINNTNPTSPEISSQQQQQPTTPSSTSTSTTTTMSWSSLIRLTQPIDSPTSPPKSSSSSDSEGNLNGNSGLSSSQKKLKSNFDKKLSWIKNFDEIIGTKSKPINISPKGLVNTSNTCFMNVILQSLMGCQHFLKLLKQISEYDGLSVQKYPILYNFVQFNSDYLSIPTHNGNSKYYNTTPPPINPKYFNDLVKSFNSTVSPPSSTNNAPVLPVVPPPLSTNISKKKLKIYTQQSSSSQQVSCQQDAQEFLTYLLDLIHEEFLSLIREYEGPVIPKEERTSTAELLDDNEWEEVGRKKGKTLIINTQKEQPKSPITQIFSGILRSSVSVNKKGAKESVTNEPFYCLHLDIRPEEINTLEDAITFFMKDEDLEGYTCSTKKTEISASKAMSIEVLPKILIVHFKRFAYDNEALKLDKMIKFPINLNLSSKAPKLVSKKYSLISVISHHGKGLSQGHYTCDVLQQDNQWIRYDDAIMSDVKEQEVLSLLAIIEISKSSSEFCYRCVNEGNICSKKLNYDFEDLESTIPDFEDKNYPKICSGMGNCINPNNSNDESVCTCTPRGNIGDSCNIYSRIDSCQVSLSCMGNTCSPHSKFLGFGEPCSSNTNCQNGNCWRGTCHYDLCIFDNECPPEYYCSLDGNCVETLKPGQECTRDTQCNIFSVCQSGKCIEKYSLEIGDNCNSTISCDISKSLYVIFKLLNNS
eukprot:gene6089-7587_t